MSKKTDEEVAAELFGQGGEPTLADAVAAEASTHPILSAEEVEAARAKARALIETKRKKAATDALIAEETRRLEQEEGLVTGNEVKDEMVSIHLDLAEHSSRIVLSGTPYYHGQTYTVPRHVADTLREIQSRGHDHQSEIEGKNIADRFRRPRNTVINTRKGITENAPQYQVGA